MNKSQALREAVRRFGPDGVAIDDGRRMASTPERRAAAQAKARELNALPDAEKKARRKERDHWFSEAFRYRFKVGKHGGFFISVRGSGDSWELAFADVDARSGDYRVKKAA